MLPSEAKYSRILTKNGFINQEDIRKKLYKRHVYKSGIFSEIDRLPDFNENLSTNIVLNVVS